MDVGQHIRKVAKKLDLTVVRADDIFTGNPVMSDIWKAINRARIVVADCTTRNPNVFYEIGLAHTIGKPVVLLTQDDKDVPFDLRHVRFIKYDFTPRGTAKLEETLGRTIESIIAEGKEGDLN